MKLRNAQLDPVELESKENCLLGQWAKQVPGFIYDGLPNAEQYVLSNIRILFILKEVNGGQAWDLREFLRNGARSQTWNVVARWVEGILNLEKEFKWNELESDNEERRNRILEKICAINVKKTSGTDVADNKIIKAAVQENKENLRRQIEIYQPDIIICCGTETPYVQIMNNAPNWKMTSRGIWYFVETNGTIVISYSHPEARTKECLLHYGLLDAIKEILHTRDINDP